MAFITIQEYFETRRKQISALAGDDHWMAHTEPDHHFYNPSPLPWYVVRESGTVDRVTDPASR